jgi:uncharacterized protein YcfJ
MKKQISAILIAIGLTASASGIPAYADPPRHAQHNRDRDWKDDRREDRREARRDYREDRRDVRQARRAPDRNWRNWRNYDYNRRDPYYGNYYADRYYRDGRYYQPRRLSRNDRIYRGSNGRYYCRRSDGTTGLIIGGAVGGLLGNEIGRGRSNTIGAIIGAGAGALLGREIERGNVRCR